MNQRQPQVVRVKQDLHLKVPTGYCGSKWTKSLPPGTMAFSPETYGSYEKTVRPTFGPDTYYFDLGCTLTVVAREKSGIIRGVSYSNVVRVDGGNAWVIHHELDQAQAERIFNICQKEEKQMRSVLEQLRMPKRQSLQRSKPTSNRSASNRKMTQ